MKRIAIQNRTQIWTSGSAVRETSLRRESEERDNLNK